MIISWYGEACFLLEAGGIRVLIEPPVKESGLASPRLKSDILIYSKFQSERLASDGENESGTFTIKGPGEYEVKGVNIFGIAEKNTVLYNIEMDGVKITHLGFLSEAIDNAKLELLDDPDIILVPVGGLPAQTGLPAQAGGNVLGAEAAMKLVNNLEPSIAIPMLYDIKGLKIKRATLDVFLEESEAKDKPLPKLSVKKKDLTEEETRIVILEKI